MTAHRARVLQVIYPDSDWRGVRVYFGRRNVTDIVTYADVASRTVWMLGDYAEGPLEAIEGTAIVRQRGKKVRITCTEQQ